MQNDGMNKASDKNNSNDCSDRRKRINRMKTIIIILVVILMIVPMIFCILLGLQVKQLQNQVDQLISLHSQYDLAEDDDDSSYAYAAVKDELHAEPTVEPLQDTKAADEDSVAVDTDALDQVLNLDNHQEESEKNVTDDKTKDTKDDTKDNIDQDAKKPEAKDKESIRKYANKKIYLTFDDGPSIYTDDILDVLKEYDVKATFFVVGKTDDYSKSMYKRIVEEGHTLGMHSYSHVYSNIYNSVEDFEKDFTKLWELLYDTTGYKPSIFRFPGGSDNMVNKHGMEDFIRYLNVNGIVYFDWNVLNGDATGREFTKEQLIDNVLSGVEWRDNSIVLMHDSQTKGTTVDSLPELLKLLKSEGAQILPIDKDVAPIQMIKADTIK